MTETLKTFPAVHAKTPITYHGPKKKTLSNGRVILGTVGVLTAVGGFIADVNKTHMKNPDWPPHAKFHDAMTITLGAFLGSASLYFLARRSFDPKLDTALSALLPSMFWAAQGISFLYPRAKGMEAEFPQLVPSVKGIWLDEKFVSLAMLSLTGIGYQMENKQIENDPSL